MREAPTFAQAIQKAVVGDDPLGLAPTSERLYNKVFPGFNNYVRYIRVYSAICWMTRQVELALNKGLASTQANASTLFHEALQKIELALLWANPGKGELAGSTRKFPAHNQPVVFQFTTFGASDATLFDAPTYQPSLTSGLLFLEQRDGDTYGCLPAGLQMAAAFEAHACNLPSHSWLRDPTKLQGRRKQVLDLQPSLDVAAPTAAEKAVFIQQFFPAKLPEAFDSDDHQRSLSLRLTLRCVDAVCRANQSAGNSGYASVAEVRACMARGLSTQGEVVTVPGLEQTQAWWAVLQVRQLQRLCIEVLWAMVERWIALRSSDGGDRGLKACCVELAESGIGHLPEEWRVTVGQTENLIGEFQAGRASFYEAAALWTSSEDDEVNAADIFRITETLLARKTLTFDDEGRCQGITSAFIGLLQCSLEVDNLKQNPDALQALKADQDACSLLQLRELVTQWRDRKVVDFIEHLVKHWAVLKHFSVVAVRSAAFDGKNRYRFVVGDDGLERFDPSRPQPRPSLAPDKLQYALLLLEQCGFLTSRHNGFRLTGSGRSRL